MSVKNVDKKGRWRNVIVSFRTTPEEKKQIDVMAELCGMSKQDYIINRLMNREIVVRGNPRVYKALKNKLAELVEELKRIEGESKVEYEFLEMIQTTVKIVEGMAHDDKE